MKAAASVLFLLSLSTVLSAAELPKLYPRGEAPQLQANPYFLVIEKCMAISKMTAFAQSGLLAAQALPSIEAAGERQGANRFDFQFGEDARPEMDAAGLLLWHEGDSSYRQGDYEAAKPVLEKIWRKYPFVRVRYFNASLWTPAQDAYDEWLVIQWMEAVRGRRMDKFPFDPNLCMYHASEDSNSKGTIGITPLLQATRKVFISDGPKLIEAAMKQMLASADFQTIAGSQYFMNMVDGLAAPLDQENEEGWMAHQERLEKWMAKDPGSSLAKLALVRFLIHYAWHARGGGYGSTVTAEGGRLFGERLIRAVEVQRKTFINHPIWYVNGLILGRGLGAKRESEEGLCEEGMKKYPWCALIAEEMQTYLLPRWYGSPGDWERFSAAIALETSVEMYVDLYHSVGHWEDQDAVRKDSLVDWSLLRKGYESVIEHDSRAWAMANRYALEACRREDKKAAWAAFSHPRFRFNALYWNGNFQSWHNWAHEKPE